MLQPIMLLPAETEENEGEKELVPFASFIAGLTDIWEPMHDPELGLYMFVEDLGLILPCEVRVETDEAGEMMIAGAPPTQHTETSIMPVFHHLRVHIAINEYGT